MQPPRASVVIPNYNYAGYLRASIDSALGQSVAAHGFEVVVVDDGSTDGSRAVIESYGDRVRSVFKANGGLSSAINAGVAESRGGLVCFLDADDVWRPDKLERVLALADANPEAVMIGHPLERVDAGGRPLGANWPPRMPVGDLAASVAKTGGHYFYPPTSGLVYPRAFLDRVGPVPESLSFPDEYYSLLASQLGAVAGTDEPLSVWRIHGQNMMTGYRGSVEKMLRSRRNFEEVNQAVNATLERLGVGRRLDLNKHLPYQLLRRRMCDGLGLLGMVRVGLWHSADPSPLRRVKALVKNLAQKPLSTDPSPPQGQEAVA